MKNKILLLAGICILFLLQSCGVSNSPNHPNPPGNLPRKLASGEKALVSSGNDFSYNIFHHVVAADSTQNVFISPLSISMALGMTLNGAAGSTKTGSEKARDMSGMKLHAINQSYKSH
jgi:serpin B